MASEDTDFDSQFAIIISRTSETDQEIITNIIMFNHKTDEFPDLEKTSKSIFSTFKTSINDHKNLANMKLHIRECILALYPNALCLTDCTLLWNLKFDVDQLKINLMNKLDKNPLFNGKINNQCTSIQTPLATAVKFFDFFSIKFRNNLGIRWYFKISGKKSAGFRLDRLVYNKIAKECMNLVLEEGRKDGFDYFNKIPKDFLTRYDNLQLLLDKMNFFNVVLLMNRDKISLFNDNYCRKVEELELHHILIKELKSYCIDSKEMI